jgi:hypothetical protein
VGEGEVRAVIDARAEGTRRRDVALLRRCVAEGARMTGRLGPDLMQGGPEPFHDAPEADEVGPDHAFEVTAPAVEGPIAWAGTRETNLPGLILRRPLPPRARRGRDVAHRLEAPRAFLRPGPEEPR